MPESRIFIENVEALKQWLIQELTPICDADPSTLAKYVVALVKKDMAEHELKDLCTKELEVFMQDKTNGFVESLFKAFADKAYMEFAPAVTTTIPHVPVGRPVLDAPTNGASQPLKVLSPLRASPDRSRTLSGGDKRRSRSGSRSPRRRDELSRGDLRQRLTDRRRHDTDRPRSRYGRYDNYRRRSPGRRSPYRRRSPRRSPGRRSPARSPGRRGRSPRRSPVRQRSWSRSRSRSRTPKARSPSTSLSASPGSPGRKRKRSKSKDSGSSTPLGEFSLDRKVKQPIIVPTTTQNAQSNRPAARPRCRDYDEKGYCMRGDLCPFDHGADPVVVEDVHLSNVLGLQGAPRAPMPRPPAPAPPMMLNRPPPQRPPMPNAAPGMPVAPSNPPPPGTVPILVPMTAPPGPGFNAAPSQRPPEPYQPEPYTPQSVPSSIAPPAAAQPQWGSDSAASGNGLVVELGSGERVVHDNREAAPQRRTVIRQAHPYQRGQYKRRGGGFNYDRLGPRKFNNENTTLEVQKIPVEMNTIAKLNEHFSKFGDITNLQICFQGDPQAAAITFSTNAQAHAAYRSTEAIFNNRFIKVFWHKKEEKAEESAEKKEEKQEIILPPAHKLQLNNMAKQNKPKEAVLVSSTGVVTRVSEATHHEMPAQEKPEALPPAPPEALTLNNQKDNKSSAFKKTIEIQKKKRLLVTKQIEQQKVLLKKLENKSMPTADRSLILKTLKVLGASVDKLKKELSASTSEVSEAIAASKKKAEQSKAPQSVEEPSSAQSTSAQFPAASGAASVAFPSKQQAQKAILDTELDIISKQNKGADITQLRVKVLELKKEVASLGLIPSQGAPRGRGSYRGRGFSRGRGFYGLNAGGGRSLDKRPKELLVTGFTAEEKEQVLAHIQNIAEVEKHEFDEDKCSLHISFMTRAAAEKAVREASNFQDKHLSLQWSNSSTTPSTSNTSAPTISNSEQVESTVKDETDVKRQRLPSELEDVDEDILLGLDEEEEEHDERSWKR